jgi:AcrR family transcriptional regulator
MVRQERATCSRRKLLRAAAEVFDELGYRATSLTTVSARAGLSTGALHYHFANKQALAEAVVQEAVDTVRRLTERATAQSADPLQQLVDSGYLLARILAGDPVLRAGLELGTGPQAPTVDAARREWRRWIQGRLSLAAQAGTLNAAVPTATVVEVIMAATVGCGSRAAATAASESWMTGLWTLLLPGMSGESAPRVRLRLDPPFCGSLPGQTRCSRAVADR